MAEDVIVELTKILIKEDFENRDNQEKFIITKKQLLSFCIKLMKLVKKFEV